MQSQISAVKMEINFKSTYESLDDLRTYMDSFYVQLREEYDVCLDEKDAYKFSLAVHEGFVNAIKHAYDGEDYHDIKVECLFVDGQIQIAIYDFGRGFDFSSVLKEKNNEEFNENGYGLQIINSLMDHVEYKRSTENMANTLLMRKRI